MAQFKYYLAPYDTIEKLETGSDYLPVGAMPEPFPQCSFCGQESPCLLIAAEANGEFSEYCFYPGPNIEAYNLKLLQGDKKKPMQPEFSYRGCLDCLKKGRYTAWHQTQAGDIVADSKLVPNRYKLLLSTEAIQELARTPRFSTWQEEFWLTHCNDFMAYIGEWGQGDFNKSAFDSSGEKLFAQVKQEEPGEQWDELRNEGFYLFKCLHCGKLRSFSDWD